MPKLPNKPCTKPGCKEYATKRGRCDSHQPTNGWQWANRPERMNGWQWSRLRAKVLERAGYVCEGCAGLRKAQEVDHIIPLSRGGTDDAHNLQALCVECHAKKTRREQAQGHRAHYTKPSK